MTAEHLRAAYRRMSFIRAFELRLDELFLQGLVAGTTHLCIGQEACAVGVCEALTADDVVFSNHRGHGHLLARGGDAARVMGEIFGRTTGYSGGRGGSQHIAVREIGFLGTHGITAGTIPLAVGAALHLKLQQRPGVGVVFFGEGALGEGIFHESVNMAAIWQLPVLLICENNAYAMSTAHRDASPVQDAAERAAAYGIASEIVDGNDVQAVFAAVSRHRLALAATPAPVFIELKTYRLSGHSRGDQRVYRDREEEEAWWRRDPLLRTRATLEQSGWSAADEDRMQQEIVAELAAAETRAQGGQDG